MGLATLMEWITDWLEEREPDAARRWLTATPVLLLALIPLAGNHLTASRKGETLARDAVRWLPARGDRKSTRLNSSHGYISYAVFCLKKKKNKKVKLSAHDL